MRLGGAAVLVCVCAAAVLLAAAGTEGNRASSAHALLESNDDAPWSRPVGKGDYWLAKEDSMELDAADALARRYVSPSPRTVAAMRGSGGAQPVCRERHILPPCEHTLRCFSDRSGRAAGRSGEASRCCRRAAAGGEPLIGGSATACEACGSRARPPSSGWLRTTTEHRLSAAGRTCCGCRCVCVCVRVYLWV